MKPNSLICLVAAAALLAPASVVCGKGSSKGKEGEHYVNGYHTKSGTYVAGHYATNPDHNFSNNYSTQGNINPHTGEAGTKRESGYTVIGYGRDTAASYGVTSASSVAPLQQSSTFIRAPEPPRSLYSAPYTSRQPSLHAVPSSIAVPNAPKASYPAVRLAGAATHHSSISPIRVGPPRPLSALESRKIHYSSGFPHDAYGTEYLPANSSSAASSWATRDSHGRIKRSEAAKREFMRMTGHPQGWPGHVVDHVIPLSKGGGDDPSNMQWQTVEEAKAKDKWERR